MRDGGLVGRGRRRDDRGRTAGSASTTGKGTLSRREAAVAVRPGPNAAVGDRGRRRRRPRGTMRGTSSRRPTRGRGRGRVHGSRGGGGRPRRPATAADALLPSQVEGADVRGAAFGPSHGHGVGIGAAGDPERDTGGGVGPYDTPREGEGRLTPGLTTGLVGRAPFFSVRPPPRHALLEPPTQAARGTRSHGQAPLPRYHIFPLRGRRSSRGGVHAPHLRKVWATSEGGSPRGCGVYSLTNGHDASSVVSLLQCNTPGARTLPRPSNRPLK